jgi:hypothetical protein
VRSIFHCVSVLSLDGFRSDPPTRTRPRRFYSITACKSTTNSGSGSDRVSASRCDGDRTRPTPTLPLRAPGFNASYPGVHRLAPENKKERRGDRGPLRRSGASPLRECVHVFPVEDECARHAVPPESRGERADVRPSDDLPGGDAENPGRFARTHQVVRLWHAARVHRMTRFRHRSISPACRRRHRA